MWLYHSCRKASIYWMKNWHFYLFQFREQEVVRLCLKHFRQHNYQEAFESLQRRTQVQLEDPVLSKLHDILVIHGDFEGTENFMEHSVGSKLHAYCFV